MSDAERLESIRATLALAQTHVDEHGVLGGASMPDLEDLLWLYSEVERLEIENTQLAVAVFDLASRVADVRPYLDDARDEEVVRERLAHTSPGEDFDTFVTEELGMDLPDNTDPNG